ncbi:MAG: hypothetical protein ABIH23_10350 [bacterium]
MIGIASTDCRVFGRTVSLLLLIFILCTVVSAQPSPRIDGGLVYLPQIDALVTVGGWGPPDWGPSAEVWAISGEGWTALPSAPVGMAHTSAAYDSAGQRLVVMGGIIQDLFTPDLPTFAFDGTSWQEIASPVSTGEYGYDPELIYDPVNNVIVGCFSGWEMPCQTWILQGDQWQRPQLAVEPPGGPDASFVWDEARQVGVWSNGAETWTWSGTSWTKMSPATHPQMDFGSFVMTYDSIRQVTVLYGKGETWTWDGAAWTRLSPAHIPDNPNRGFFAFGFDSSRGVAVLYGGEPADSQGDSLYDDVWEWTGEDWRPFTPVVGIEDWAIY